MTTPRQHAQKRARAVAAGKPLARPTWTPGPDHPWKKAATRDWMRKQARAKP